MSNDKYILDADGNPVPEPDTLKWAQWFETSGPSRIVARTAVGDLEVSTVFLALDYSFGAKVPILFETMTFKKDGEPGEAVDDDDQLFDRYETRQQAIKGHIEMVKYLEEKQKKLPPLFK